MKQTLYFKLLRNRTNEIIHLELSSALETIKRYDDKQKFMNLLGQDTFWKKNRLDLWAALTDIAIDAKDLPQDLTRGLHFRDAITFEHTDIMLRKIVYEMIIFYENKIAKERKIEHHGLNIRHSDWIWDNELTIRKRNTRCMSVDPDYFHIRNDDMPKFQQEYQALLAKYAVDNAAQLNKGRQIFPDDDVARRYVSLAYGLPTKQFEW